MFAMMCLCLWAVVIVLLGILIVRPYLSAYKFFVTLQVPYEQPKPIFGNMFGIIFRRWSFSEMVTTYYQKFENHSCFGIFDFHKPVLMIRDPDLVRLMLVRDFDHFVDHRQIVPNTDCCESLFGKSLYMLSGDRWRDMRATLTPAFTGSKLRGMFRFVHQITQQYAAAMRAESEHQKRPYIVEMKDLSLRFATDVIGSTAFGIQANAPNSRANEFYALGRETLRYNSRRFQLKLALIFMCPALFKWLGWRLFDDKQKSFCHRLVHDSMRARELSGEHRPDMIHQLMQAKKGFLQHEEELLASGGGADFMRGMEVEAGNEDLCGFQKRFWNDEDITAQCYLFFFTGCETISSLISFAVQELMENWPVQQRLIEEIDAVRRGLNGDEAVTYDTLMGCRYLDMVVYETLRKWPPGSILDRVCTKEYTFTDSHGQTITLPKGTNIWVPTMPIQRDPRYYPEPERFDPERFSDERKGSIQQCTLLALGIGPRNCIGSRFALMEVKAFLFDLLSTFTFEVGATSDVPVRLRGHGWLLKARNGINVHFRLRQ